MAALNQLELVACVDEIFSAGVPIIQFLQLKEADAMRYQRYLKSDNRFKTSINGPSTANDPQDEIECYSLTIHRR